MRHLLLAPLCVLAQAQGLNLHGTLLGQDGKPMALAHVRALSLEGVEIASTAADAQGRFSLRAEAKGFVNLVATGVGHQSLSLPLPCDGRALEATIRLSADPLSVTKPEAVEVAANGKLGARHAMQKGADGIWRASVEASGPELRYEVDGVSGNGHTLNGTAAARYEYDGDSDYLSVTSVKNGKAEVCFDPMAFPASPGMASIAFAKEAVLNRYAAAQMQLQDLNSRTMAVLRRAVQTGVRPELPPPAAELQTWRDALKTETDPLVRQALWNALVSFGAKDPDYASLPKELPPNSPFFSMNPFLATAAPHRMPEGPARDAYQADIFRALPEKAAGTLVKQDLSGLIYEGRAAEAKAKLAAYEAARPNLPIYAALAAQIDATIRVSVGAAVPAFQIADLDDAKTVYSPAAFQGKFVLLDFWATWCGPCRAEMPQLHAAYAKFHSRGLEVLSLSFDQAARDVAPYRADAAHPMPWHHAFVEKGFQSDLAKAFAVTGIPKPILVGPDGKIVAMGISLRGEALEQTLAKVLPAPAAGSN